MSTLLELPTATIEWALLSPLIVLLGVAIPVQIQMMTHSTWQVGLSVTLTGASRCRRTSSRSTSRPTQRPAI